MKKLILILTALLLCASVLLAACDGDGEESHSASNGDSSAVESQSNDGESNGNDSSEITSNDVSDNSSTETSDDTSSETSNDTSDDTSDDTSNGNQPLENDPIKVLSCSYTEKPYFACVGTCAKGAIVTAKVGAKIESCVSYNGLFSLRLPCNTASISITLSQTVNGTPIGEPLKYDASPETPYSGAWPLIAGKNYQFFLEKMIDDYDGTTVNKASVYTDFTSRLRDRLTQLRSYNSDAEIIYLLVPSPMTVYPELLPDQYKNKAASQTNLDKTMAAINASGATAINLKQIFAQHKNDEMPLYYKLDSHWADYGAYVAYEALFDHISQKFPDAAPRSVDEFNWKADYYEGGDVAYYLSSSEANAPNLQKQIREFAFFRTFKDSIPTSISSVARYRSDTMLCYNTVTMPAERNIYTNRSNLPSCIVVRDSYSTQIYDILAERMNKTHYLAMWDYGWSTKRISVEKPDYIIYVVSEWNINDLVRYG